MRRRGRWWWRRRPRPRISSSACMPRSRISWCSRRSRNTPSRWACSRSTRPRSPACASSCRQRSRDGAKSWNRPESPARNEAQDATLLPNRARRAPRAGDQDWGTAMSAPLLSVRGVKAYYGHIAALRGVDVDVGEGEIVALIGANGAGKSTLMMTIFGNPRAREGRITFAGRDITQLPTHEIARLKIAQAPEGRRIFVRMSVMENLQMGAAVADAALSGRRRPRVCIVSPPQGAYRPARRHALGRRAADAGDRARADGTPAPPPPRRAFARPGAADRAPDLRRDQEAQHRRKAHRVLGGAECVPRLEACAPRLCHGQRPDHAQWKRARAAGAARGEGGLSRGR